MAFASPAGRHWFVLDEEDVLWGCVSSQFGMPSDSSEVPLQRIVWEGTRPAIADICCGGGHTLLLDQGGAVWCSGEGMLIGFTQVPYLPKIVRIAAGGAHCLALDERGGVWSWAVGDDSDGSGCVGRLSSPLEALPVEGLPPIRQIACGFQFSLAEAMDGSLWSFGSNNDGQLGIGHKEPSIQPASVVIPHFPDGPLRGLHAGGQNGLLIDSNGGCWTSGWHYGLLGRCGDPTIFQRIEG